MLVILFGTCEMGMRIRLAYLYRSLDWVFYHQFKFRTMDDIMKDFPKYYKNAVFKPFSLVYRNEIPKQRKDIITIESSALRSIRKQLQKITINNPHFVWINYSPNENKEIEFSNNSIVLYELFVYPDIDITIKSESRILKKIFGPTLDDFLYHNFVFYLHLDEEINFTTMNADSAVKEYIDLLISREEPFCEDIRANNYTNIFYVLTPNRFNSDSSGGRIYLKYIDAAYKTIIALLNKYGVPYIDLMKEQVAREDLKDYFHLSPEGGIKMSYKILDYLAKRGF